VVLLQELILQWDVAVIHRHSQLAFAQQPLFSQIVVYPILRLLKVVDNVIAIEIIRIQSMSISHLLGLQLRVVLVHSHHLGHQQRLGITHGSIQGQTPSTT